MPSLCDIFKKNSEKRNGGVIAMPGVKRAVASVFWVGEDAGPDNGGIHNHSSAWDPQWAQHAASENRFYVALPYNDIDDNGARKPESFNIPWFPVNGVQPPRSICKNRWIEVRHKHLVCYGQWEDVGPFGEDDWDYVFGGAQEPRNARILGAGIDISPAMAEILQIDGSGLVEWRHFHVHEVPDGPWRDVITTSEGPSWAK